MNDAVDDGVPHSQSLFESTLRRIRCLRPAIIVIPTEVLEHSKRHRTMTLTVYFDVSFEIVFEHCEPLESIPQIMNDLPEHSRN